jgi:mono/diheme cytochrome c family protein
MMYVKSEPEIREWILYGRPKRLEHDPRYEVSEHPDPPRARDDQRDQPPKLPLQMPAFAGIVRGKKLDDLVAFYKAVAVFDPIPADAHEGYRVASRLGCFGCHGPGGRLGSSNPRSFKGYIPPWQGADFAELVKNNDELRQWILEGGTDRFDSNPFARFFTRRQVIRMPAYRDVLSDEELEALITYIRWLQNHES